MTSIEVRRVQAIREFRAALTARLGKLHAALEESEAEAKRALEWAESEVRAARRSLARAQAELESALAAWHSCDEEDDDYYADVVSERRGEVALAEHQLTQARKHHEQIRLACESYFRVVRQGWDAVSRGRNTMPVRLDQFAGALGRFEAKQDVMVEGSPAAASAQAAPVASAPAAAAPAAHSSATAQARKGFEMRAAVEFPVGLIDLSQAHVQGASDFRKVPFEEMARGVRQLRDVVRPAVTAGADGDTFRELDERRGTRPASGLLRIYQAFYGDSAIKLTFDGERWSAENGVHRLWAAQQLGVESLPARISMRPQDWAAYEQTGSLPGAKP